MKTFQGSPGVNHAVGAKSLPGPTDVAHVLLTVASQAEGVTLQVIDGLPVLASRMYSLQHPEMELGKSTNRRVVRTLS